MEGLVPATATTAASTFQVILKHLCSVLLLITESLRCVPALPAFPWVILVGTPVVVSLTVMRLRNVRRVKVLGERYLVPDKFCEECNKNSGLMTTANDALKLPKVNTSPLQKQSMAPTKQVLQGRVSQPLSMEGNPLQTSPRPEIPRGHLASVKVQVKQQRGAGNGDWFIHRSDDLQGVLCEVDLNVSLQPAEKEDQQSARQLQEQKQVNEELAGKVVRLQTEKSSLQCEHSNLKDEIWQLKLKLEVQPDTHEDHFTQLQKRLFEESCLSEMEKKFHNDYKYMSSTYQILNTYKKMVQDLNQELQRSMIYYDKEIRYYQDRAEEAWMAAEHMGREIHELQRENDYNRWMLANTEFFQPFPGVPFAPTVPPAALRGPEVPFHPLGHQAPKKEGQGPAVRAPKFRVTFKL